MFHIRCSFLTPLLITLANRVRSIFLFVFHKYVYNKGIQYQINVENILLYLASSSCCAAQTIFHVFMQRKICNSVSNVVVVYFFSRVRIRYANPVAWIKFTHFLRKLQYIFCISFQNYMNINICV